MIMIYALNINCQEAEANVERAMACLTKARQNQILRYKNKRDGLRSLYGEALARTVLASRLDCRPQQIEIFYNSYGKPYILDYAWHYSVSHSGDYVGCAVSRRNIGFDLQQMKQANLKIAKRFFSANEYQLLLSKKMADCENQTQRELFFKLWTLKESYVKYKGTGAAISFSSFEFCERDVDQKLVLHSNSERLFTENGLINGQYAYGIVSEEQTKDLNVKEWSIENALRYNN